MSKPLHTKRLEWKGSVHVLELYESDSFEGLNPIKQVQAIPFFDDDHVVLYKNVQGRYGLPGGTIEAGESPEAALTREVKEESACEVLDFGLLGYIKDIMVGPPERAQYQLRYWARVKMLDEPVHDPDGSAVSREIVSLNNAAKMLNWGELGDVLLKLAVQKFQHVK